MISDLMNPNLMNTDLINPGVLERARKIKLLLLDVDGVLTDGKLYFSNTGDELKTFSTLDGHGIKLLQRSGVKVGIISGRKSALVAKRASDLGIEILVQGREDKWDALQEVLATRSEEHTSELQSRENLV